MSDGLFESALFCPKCESVYRLKLVRVASKHVTESFLQQCRNEVQMKKIKFGEFEVVVDEDMPEGEIHFVRKGKCVGKIVGTGDKE